MPVAEATLPGTTTCSRCTAHPARRAASTAYRSAGPASSSTATRMDGLTACIVHLAVGAVGGLSGADRLSDGQEGRHVRDPGPAPSLVGAHAPTKRATAPVGRDH